MRWLFFLLLMPAVASAQLKFGFRSGVGVHVDFMDYNILAPHDDNVYVRDKPLIDKPDPRSNQKVYYGLAHQHEFFISKNKSQLKFGVAFAR